MERFFAYPDDIGKDYLCIRDQEAHHIKDVLRHGIGDKLSIFDGEGNTFEGEIENMRADEVKIKILKYKAEDKFFPLLHLVQAIPRKQKMDFIVEKATELGVDEIIPVITERTIVRPHGDKQNKLIARWRKISIEAAKQSKQTFLPRIGQIKTFNQVIKSMPKGGIRIIPYLGQVNTTLKDISWDKSNKDIFIFIGPEGDFCEEEVALAKDNGVIPVSLGSNVLKSETAAIFLLSILNYELKGA